MSESFNDEKNTGSEKVDEKFAGHQVEEVALVGHAATDSQGKALFAVDVEAESKLRRKVWLISCTIPTLNLL